MTTPEEGEVCSICQDILVDKMYRLKCGHSVHDNCILDSFQKSGSSAKTIPNEKFIRKKPNGHLVSETLGEFKCPICRNFQFVLLTQEYEYSTETGYSTEVEKEMVAKIIIANNVIEKKFHEIWIQNPSQILKIGQKIKNITMTFDIINQLFKSDQVVNLHLTANKLVVGDLDPKLTHMTLDQFYRLFMKKITGNQCRPCPFTTPREDVDWSSGSSGESC